MGRYIIRRLLWMPLILMVVGLITFSLGLYGPGDPANVLLGQHNSPEAQARIRAKWGLDLPFHEQFGSYMLRAVQGDFGESFKYRRDVSDLLVSRIGVSMQLALAALVLAFAVGVPLGTYAAYKQGT